MPLFLRPFLPKFPLLTVHNIITNSIYFNNNPVENANKYISDTYLSFVVSYSAKGKVRTF